MRTHPSAHGVVLLVLAAVLAGCGGSSGSTGSNSTPSPTPPVCGDLAGVQQSVQGLKDTTVQRGALPDLQAKAQALGQQLKELKADAKEQFHGEVNALSLSLSSLSASVKGAAADPSARSLAAVVPNLAAVKASANALVTAVQKTC